MKIYKHDDAGAFCTAGVARENPLEAGEYLVPRNATKTAPPATGEGEVAIFDGAKWSVTEDHRGEEAFTEAGKTVTVGLTGPLSSHGLTARYTPPAPTAEEITESNNSGHRAYLASTDWYIIRLLESATPVPDDVLVARIEAREGIV